MARRPGGVSVCDIMCIKVLVPRWLVWLGSDLDIRAAESVDRYISKGTPCYRPAFCSCLRSSDKHVYLSSSFLPNLFHITYSCLMNIHKDHKSELFIT